MDIFETLRLEHAAILKMLDDVIDTSRVPEVKLEATPESGLTMEVDWSDLFNDFRLALLTHNRAEEEVFYDLLNEVPGREDLADAKGREHDLVERLMDDLHRLDPREPGWIERLSLIRKNLVNHISEEETNVFALLRPLIDDQRSHQLAEEFEAVHDRVADHVLPQRMDLTEMPVEGP